MDSETNQKVFLAAVWQDGRAGRKHGTLRERKEEERRRGEEERRGVEERRGGCRLDVWRRRQESDGDVQIGFAVAASGTRCCYVHQQTCSSRTDDVFSALSPAGHLHPSLLR